MKRPLPANILTTAELAKALGITPRLLLHRATAHGVEPTGQIGRMLLWDRSAIKLLQPRPVGYPKGRPRSEAEPPHKGPVAKRQRTKKPPERTPPRRKRA